MKKKKKEREEENVYNEHAFPLLFFPFYSYVLKKQIGYFRNLYYFFFLSARLMSFFSWYLK